jgi:hypothetical protein
MKYAILLPVLLAGCTDNNASVDIDRYLAVTPTSMCVADPANLINRSFGILDVGIVAAGATGGLPGYLAAPVVRNNMPLRAPMGQIDLDAVTIKGFDVQLNLPGTVAAAVTQPNFFVQTASQRIDAGGAVTAAIEVEIIPSGVARQLVSVVPVGTTNLPQVVAHLRPVAERVDGSTFNGGWSDFPVTLCNLCLPAATALACPLKASQAVSSGCFPQQDESQTCCVSGNQVLCGSRVPVM